MEIHLKTKPLNFTIQYMKTMLFIHAELLLQSILKQGTAKILMLI